MKNELSCLFSCTLAAVLITCSAITSTAQMRRTLYTDKGKTLDVPISHPLTWWTKDPLRLDESDDLMIGFKADNGHVVSAADYKVVQNVKRLGAIAGFPIVQLDTEIEGGGLPSPAWWKSLLVKSGEDKYLEIYSLQSDLDVSGDVNGHEQWAAEIHGSGRNAVLWTQDSAGGNCEISCKPDRGACFEGYWWFDAAGAHPVKFKPLYNAIKQAIPRNSNFNPSCEALHIEQSYLESPVQAANADRHAGYLGTVHASFKIRNRVAIPISVSFKYAVSE